MTGVFLTVFSQCLENYDRFFICWNDPYDKSYQSFLESNCWTTSCLIYCPWKAKYNKVSDSGSWELLVKVHCCTYVSVTCTICRLFAVKCCCFLWFWNNFHQIIMRMDLGSGDIMCAISCLTYIFVAILRLSKPSPHHHHHLSSSNNSVHVRHAGEKHISVIAVYITCYCI